MEANALRQAINTAVPAFGAFVLLEGGSAEAMANSGFGFLVIDAQHGAFDASALKALLYAMNATSAAAIVHVHADRPDEIEAVLDLGADGVMVPNVNSAAAARRAVAACRYPTEGVRSVGGIRNGLVRGADYFAAANDDVVCIIQIEHASALEHLDEILAVPGVDAVCAGPVDLARSLGSTGSYLDATAAAGLVAEALTQIEAAAGRAGIPFMAVATDADSMRRSVARGHRLSIVATDFHLLLSGSKRQLSAARAAWTLPAEHAATSGTPHVPTDVKDGNGAV